MGPPGCRAAVPTGLRLARVLLLLLLLLLPLAEVLLPHDGRGQDVEVQHLH